MSGETTSGSGTVNPSGEGATESAPSVDIDNIVNKVTESVSNKLADMVTGAVKRNVENAFASKFDGVDFDALKGLKPPTPPEGKSKGNGQPDPALLARLDAAEKSAGDALKAVDKWKSKALQATIYAQLDEFGANKDAREILAPQIASKVQESNDNLFVVENDISKPMNDYIREYLDARPGLKTSQSRTGTGAGGGQNEFAEPMPATKAELMYSKDEKDIDLQTGKRRLTGDRVAAFKRAHPGVWEKLPMGTVPH